MSNSLNLNIREWLKSIDLEEYVQLFVSNNIDYEILLTIDGSDLKEMGINSLGHRKKSSILYRKLKMLLLRKMFSWIKNQSKFLLVMGTTNLLLKW